MTDRLVVALVRGIHGLRGDVRLEVLTDQPERRFAPGSVLYLEGDATPLTIAAATEISDGPGWRVRFRELGDRTAVDPLRGKYLEAIVEPDDTRSPESVYWHELMGVVVTGLDGAELGSIHDVYSVGETDTVVVKGGPVGEFDLPLLRAFIREFDPRAGRFVVDAALLDLDVRAPADAADRPRAPRRRQGSRRKGGSNADSPDTDPSPPALPDEG